MERRAQTGSNGTTNGFYVGANRHQQQARGRNAKGLSSSLVARELLVIPPPAAYCSRSRVFALVGPLLHIYLHIPVYLERQHSVP